METDKGPTVIARIYPKLEVGGIRTTRRGGDITPDIEYFPGVGRHTGYIGDGKGGRRSGQPGGCSCSRNTAHQDVRDRGRSGIGRYRPFCHGHRAGTGSRRRWQGGDLQVIRGIITRVYAVEIQVPGRIGIKAFIRSCDGDLDRAAAQGGYGDIRKGQGLVAVGHGSWRGRSAVGVGHCGAFDLHATCTARQGIDEVHVADGGRARIVDREGQR